MTDKKLKIEYIAIEKLVPCPQNPRKNDTNVEALTKSMAAFGWTNPILARRQDLMVVAGHTRLKSAKAQGLKEVPVIFLDLDPADAKTYMIADNRLTEIVEWDNLKLGELFSELEEMDLDISLTGFNVDEISSYTRRRPEGQTDPDAIPEIVASITNPGDLWQLGDHRLLCGDATNADDVKRLMDGDKADMVFTDPPYGVGFKYNSYNDNISKEEHEIFCKKWVHILQKFSDFIVITPGFDNEYIYYRIEESFSSLVWFKKFSISASKIAFARTCEPIFVLGKPPIQRYNTDYFAFGTDREKGLIGKHPCPKPVDLLIALIEPQTKNNHIVLDVFMGSGSTLIACEKTCRKCYGMEIDPHYCDVIIKRWEDFTGKKAKRLSPDKKSAVKKKAAPKKKVVKKKIKKKVAS